MLLLDTGCRVAEASAMISADTFHQHCLRLCERYVDNQCLRVSGQFAADSSRTTYLSSNKYPLPPPRIELCVLTSPRRRIERRRTLERLLHFGMRTIVSYTQIFETTADKLHGGKKVLTS